MMQTDSAPAKIAQFTKFDIKPDRAVYVIVDRPTSNPIARRRLFRTPIASKFFYWSNVKGRWTIFSNMGRMS